VLVFSLLHGLLYFYPDFKQNLIIDKDLIYFSFHDGNYFYNSDEITHGPAIRRFYDFFRFGTFNFNDPITGTNISSYNLMIFPYILGGFISYILGGVDKFFFYKNFIFPFCGYLFSFFLLRTFFRSFLICLFGAILFYGELFAIQHILKYLIFDPLLWSKETGLNVQALYYPSRQLGLILYFVALFVIFKVLENKDYQIMNGAFNVSAGNTRETVDSFYYMKKMNEAVLKKAGAIAVVKFGKGVQVVMGTLSDNIESEMRRQMKR
jgi:hypothetical protein